MLKYQLLRVLVYYIPIPMFFALYEQLVCIFICKNSIHIQVFTLYVRNQGSRWTLMATRMDGRIGNSSFIIKPDQMQV